MYQMIFRISTEIKNELKIEANKRGQTLTGLLRQIIYDWLQETKGGKQ